MRTTLLHNWTGLTFALLFLWATPLAQAQQQQVAEQEQVKARTAYIEGLAAFENEEYQRAIKLLKSAYVKLADRPGVSFALADAYLQINDLDNAEYYAKQATKLDPQNRWYHLKLVHIYQAAGKNDSAISELKKALTHHPRNSDLLYQLAQLYDNRGDARQANTIYNKLLYLDGENVNIRLRRLNNFDSMGKRDSVIAELQKIRQLEPGNLSTLQVLSEYYLEMDRLQEAREVLQRALQISDNDPESLIMLSDIYMAQGKWDSVATTLRGVIADTSVATQTKLKVSRYLYSKFEKNSNSADIRKAAGTVFEQFLSSGTESGEAMELAADFFTQSNQPELALQALERTNELVPTNDSAWKKRLQLLLQAGNSSKAVTVGEKAVDQIPQDPIVMYFLGSAYLSQQQPDRAIEQLKSAATLPARRPLKANIHGALGNAYAATEQWEAAFEEYERSLKFDGENPSILNNYAYYLANRDQDLAKARQMAKRALELDPENPSYLDTIGWIYYQQGDYQKARQLVQSAIDSGTPTADMMEHMGDILDKMGKEQQAHNWWQKALQKDPSRTHLKDKIST
ncbi:MAG: tetratricopeptide repeat protein [Fodinibius sp.]|nr:tetratricopeptide repeat protein [Fodinibius sp.]